MLTETRPCPRLDLAAPDVDEVTALAALLADRTRAGILALLRDGPHCVCEFAATFGERENNVSNHLTKLRARGSRPCQPAWGGRPPECTTSATRRPSRPPGGACSRCSDDRGRYRDSAPGPLDPVTPGCGSHRAGLSVGPRRGGSGQPDRPGATLSRGERGSRWSAGTSGATATSQEAGRRATLRARLGGERAAAVAAHHRLPARPSPSTVARPELHVTATSISSTAGSSVGMSPPTTGRLDSTILARQSG